MPSALEERRFWTEVTRELAHQMGTPLSALMGWLELLPSLKDPTQALAGMQHDLARLVLIGERLSQVADPPPPVPIAVRELVEEIQAWAARKLPPPGSGISFRVDVQQNLAVLARPELLVWALEHLLKNAVDAVFQGGSIVLRVRVEDAFGILEVEDDGPGIAAQQCARVFDPGFTTKEGARGIGLPLARHIARSSGGDLTIETPPGGRGCLARLRLRRA